MAETETNDDDDVVAGLVRSALDDFAGPVSGFERTTGPRADLLRVEPRRYIFDDAAPYDIGGDDDDYDDVWRPRFVVIVSTHCLRFQSPLFDHNNTFSWETTVAELSCPVWSAIPHTVIPHLLQSELLRTPALRRILLAARVRWIRAQRVPVVYFDFTGTRTPLTVGRAIAAGGLTEVCALVARLNRRHGQSSSSTPPLSPPALQMVNVRAFGAVDDIELPPLGPDFVAYMADNADTVGCYPPRYTADAGPTPSRPVVIFRGRRMTGADCDIVSAPHPNRVPPF